MDQQKIISLSLKGSPKVQLAYIVEQDYLKHLQRGLSEDELALIYLSRVGVLNVKVRPHRFTEEG